MSNVPPDLAKVVHDKFRELLDEAAKHADTDEPEEQILSIEEVELSGQERKELAKLMSRLESHIELDSLAKQMGVAFGKMIPDAKHAKDMGETLMGIMLTGTQAAAECEGDPKQKVAAYNRVVQGWFENGFNMYQLAAVAIVYCLCRYVQANILQQEDKSGAEDAAPAPSDESGDGNGVPQSTEGATDDIAEE